MILKPMRFKDYTWPHNPECYLAEYRREIAARKVPFGKTVMQDLGETWQILRGEGTFAGFGAYEEFRKLAAVFQQGGPGLLIHPIWPVAEAYFVALRLREEPLPDYVHYEFEFWETTGAAPGLTRVQVETGKPSGGSPAQTGRVYLVKKGDTLWGIARRYHVSLSALIRANPQIKNPNRIYPGNRVTIP